MCLFFSLQMERRFQNQLKNMKARLEQSDSTNHSLQNYVQFLKASYSNVFGDSVLSSSLHTHLPIWLNSVSLILYELCTNDLFVIFSIHVLYIVYQNYDKILKWKWTIRHVSLLHKQQTHNMYKKRNTGTYPVFFPSIFLRYIKKYICFDLIVCIMRSK